MAGLPSQQPPHRQMRPVPPSSAGSGWPPQPPQQFQQQHPSQQQTQQQPNLQMNQQQQQPLQQQPFQPQPVTYQQQQQQRAFRPQPPSIPPQRPMRPQPPSLQPQRQQQHQAHLQPPPPQMHRPQQLHPQQSLSQQPQPQLGPQPPFRPMPPQSNPNAPPGLRTMSQPVPPAMRPPPNYQPDPAAFSAMSLHPAATGPPPGMRTPTITDPRTLPRPQTAGQAVSMRIVSGDPPPHQPMVDPAACPAHIFKPTSTRAVRLCNTNFPSSGMLSRKYGLPLGAIVHPLARPAPDDEPVPIVNFGATGIVRCRRCRSYINFTCSFRDGGRRWICTMCSYSNEVPSDYFAPLDQNGKRTDAANRPELHRGSVEFVAPAEYMVRPPMPPVYLFVLETTPAAANSGALDAAVMGIKRSINSMPSEGRTRVGILTFDSAVHFFALKPGEDAEPASYVVSDINDIFLPTPQSIIVQLDECRPCFESALDTIAATYKQTSNMVSAPSCLGAALKGAQRVLEHTGGKVLIFAASRPTIGPGALRERGDNSILGTDRERAILRSDSSIYSQMAVSMSKHQISCDLFVCVPPPGRFMDLASLAPLVKYTGGELFFCPLFDAPKDAPRLQLAINRTLARETGLEAVMRIRATKGVRCTQFSGRFFVRSTDLLAMPNVDSDKAYAVQFAFDESTLGDGPFCLQVALLYTTTSGERRIRVHTLAAPVTKSLSDLYVSVDAAATANIFLRQAAEGMKDRALVEMKKNMTEKVVNALAKYREVCITQYPPAASSSQLLLPDSMILLPLFMHGLVKTPILSRDAAGAFLHKFDDKSALAHSVDVMNVAETSAMLYPNVIPIYPWPGGNQKLVKHPDGAAATVGSLRPDVGVLIDHGTSVILWLGPAVLQAFTTELLGSSVTGPVDPRYLGVELMRRGGAAKGPVAQVFSALKHILEARRSGLPLHVVPAGDQRMQPRVEALMTEDRTASSGNYREFLLETQNRVSQIAVKR